jgi:FdhD protein
MIGQGRPTRAVRIDRHRDGRAVEQKDTVAVEEPLEIRVSWVDGRVRRVEPLAVTMRTPGDDFELVAGFLHGEGIVSTTEDLHELTYCRGDEDQEYNVVEARLRPGVPFDADAMRRNVFTSSSCGICGKASIDAVQATGCSVLAPGFQVSSTLLPDLPDRLLAAQSVFARTGGIHAAGLFQADGSRQVLREDVGRHNAVDKVLGHSLLHRVLPARDRVLVVSGRASFEIVQKALMAQVPVLVAVGAPSSLAVDLASQFQQTLVGFARDGGFNVYCGAERVR